MRHSLNRALAVPAATLALLAGAAGIGATLGGSDPRPPATAQCEESMPCWDCHTDGNRVCAVTEAQRATAWQAWDQARGWTLLRINPELPYIVEVTGYSTEPTRPDGVTLRGADGLWYVFTVTYTR